MSLRARLLVPAVAILGALAGLATAAAAQARAPDGVPIDADGHPQYATFSLCAVDPATGQSGAAVTTRVPFVGRAVPHVRAGVGAVCTQASTVVEYGPRGLDLLAKGVEPKAVLEQLLATDERRETRQVGVIDMRGRAAAHTGQQNGAWAGSRQGPNYTVQANIMVGPEVIQAVAERFESTARTGWPLAERMILALEAGQAKGGDRRWGSLQSAAIKIADPKNPGRGGDYIALAIEVGEHPEPVGEMKRIYYTTSRRLGYRTFSRVEGTDVVELKRMLHALGFWRPELAAFPEDTRELQLYDEEAIAAVDKFRAAHDLNYQGNARGLVDERFVEALRAAYIRKTAGGQGGSYARPELLVSAAWLAGHLTDPDVRVVDLRPRGYDTAHIPGAVYLANNDIRNPSRPPAFVPDVAAFEALMGRLGISNRTRVIAYDDRGGIYAARLWWILNYFGHANVALLDGGWTAWTAGGHPTSADVPASRPGAAFTATPNPRWIATADEVVAAINRPDVKIVDARTTAEIEGRDLRGIRRGGAIPASIPIYWEDAFDRTTHLLKPAADLRTLYEDKGIRPEHEVIAYCQVGMRASHDLFVLRLIGYDNLKNYYGAWEEWGNRDDLPIGK